MPDNCYDCPLMTDYGTCGYYAFYTKEAEKGADWEKRLDNCPLIELPPHGRLIDADALIADIRKNSESYWADDFAREWVNRQETIIKAEEET